MTFWHTYNVAFLPFVDEVLARFARRFPEVSVRSEAIPAGDFGTKLTTAVQGGAAPDVVIMFTTDAPDFVAMGALEDLSGRIATWSDRTQIPNDIWQSVNRGGITYGVPHFMFVDWLYYRRDWLAEAGLQPPKNWDDFLKIARAVTDPGKKRYGFGLRGGNGGEWYILTWLFAAGADLVDAQKRVTLNSPEAVMGFQWYVDLFAKHNVAPPSAPTDAFRQTMDAFKTGQTGMFVQHTGTFKEASDALGDKLGIVPVPAGPKKQVALVGPGVNAVSKTSKNKDAAWELVKFWAEADTEQYWFQQTGYFPSRQDVAAKTVDADRRYEPAFETLAKYARPYPDFAGFSGWMTTSLRPTLQAGLLGKITATDAVSKLAADLEKAIR